MPSLHLRTLTLIIALVFAIELSIAQLIGDDANLAHLEQQAEELIAQGDPHGAALSSGKAALLAAQIAKQTADQVNTHYYHAMSQLLRTQETVYRAVGLFQQSGERIPASSGVCDLLTLGMQHNDEAQRVITTDSVRSSTQNSTLQTRVREWMEIVQELQQEWDCGN